MEKELLKIKAPLPKNKRLFNILLYPFDMPVLVKNIKCTHGRVKAELNAMILVKNQHKQMVLTMFHEIQESNIFRQKIQFPFK